MTTEKYLLHAADSNRLFWFTKNSVLRLVNFLDPQDMHNYDVVVIRNGERLGWSLGHSGIYLQANDTVEITARELQRTPVDICEQEIKIGDDWVSLGAVTLDAFARTTTLAVTQGFANSDGDPGYSLTPGDPLLPSLIISGVEYGNVAYELTIVSSGASGTVLSWTYPPSFRGGEVVPGSGTGAGTTHWPAFGLTLQRSPASLAMPYVAPFNISVNQTTARATLTTPDWVNVQTWTGTVDTLPTTYTDTAAPNPNYNYRLILQMGPFNVGGNAVAELDWNVVSAVKSYTTFAGSNVNGQTTLSWTIPPGTAHFDIYRSTVAGTFPGSPTYANVSASAATYGPIADSSLPVYYRLRATLANGLVVSFNDLTVGTSPAGMPVWANNFGGSDYDVGTAITADSNGNTFSVGTFRVVSPSTIPFGTFNLSAGTFGAAAYLIKMNSAGSVTIAKATTGPGIIFPTCVALDSSGSIYVGGQFTTPTLASLQTTFNMPAPGASTGALNVSSAAAFTLNGNVKVKNSGYFQVTTINTGANTIVLKNLGYNRNVAEGVSVSSGQQIADTTTFGGAGESQASVLGSGSCFLAKYDSAGNGLWSISCGLGAAQVNGVAVDSLGNVVLVGFFGGAVGTMQVRGTDGAGTDLYSTSGAVLLAKFSPSGAYVFAKDLSSFGSDRAFAVSIDKRHDSILIIGKSDNQINFGGGVIAGPTGWLVKLDSAGGYLAQKAIPTTSVTGMALDSTSSVVVCGSWGGSVNFGGGTTTGQQGAVNGFVVRYGIDDFAWKSEALVLANDLVGVLALAVDSQNSVYLTGYQRGTVTSGTKTWTTPAQIFFAMKCESSGAIINATPLWVSMFTNTGSNVNTSYGSGITVSSFGNPVVTGTFIGSATIGAINLPGKGLNDAFVIELTR